VLHLRRDEEQATMQPTTELQQLCRDVRLLRGALFALGGFCILASLVIAAFRLAGPDAFYSNIVMMGFGFGISLLILGLLAGGQGATDRCGCCL